MKNSSLISALFLLLIVMVVASDAELIRVNTSMNWISAAKYCKTNNSVLASNISEIAAAELSIPGNTLLWIGIYEVLTKWTLIRGCFYLNNTNLNNVTANLLKCKALCDNHKYFAIQFNGTDCHCLDEVLSRTCKCNEINCYCYQMYEYFSPNENTDNKDKLCLYAKECIEDKVIILSENCVVNYKFVCDNNISLPGWDLSYEEASLRCYHNGSFIKWFTDADCSIPHQYWTSGHRGNTLLSLETDIDAYSLNRHNAQRCKRLNRHENTLGSCSDKNKFYCKKGTPSSIDTSSTLETTVFYFTDQTAQFISSSDEDATTVINPTDMKEVQDLSETKSDAIIVGAVISTTVIIVIVVVVVTVIMRRRLGRKDDKKSPATDPYVYSNADPSQTQQRSFSVANQSYDDIKDGFLKSSNGTTLSSNYQLAKGANKVKQGTTPVPCYAQVNKINTSEYYEFAQPVANESNYVYNSDYDHLHKVLKPPKESDYALTCPELKCERDSNAYDTFASSNASDGQHAVSEYDHLPTKIDNDPTYDCAALKSRKHEENNYDSFSR